MVFFHSFFAYSFRYFHSLYIQGNCDDSQHEFRVCVKELQFRIRWYDNTDERDENETMVAEKESRERDEWNSYPLEMIWNTLMVFYSVVSTYSRTIFHDFFSSIYAWKENAFLFKYECRTRYYEGKKGKEMNMKKNKTITGKETECQIVVKIWRKESDTNKHKRVAFSWEN